MVTMVMTDVGINAAIAAEAGGFRLNINTYKLGASAGFTPVVGDTNIHGSKVDEGAPVNISATGPNNVEYIIDLNVNKGDFNFGNIGLFLDTGELFALGSLATVQSKIKTVGSNAGNSIEIHAQITFTNIAPLISFSIIAFSGIPELATVNLLEDPLASTSNAFLILDNNEKNQSAIAFKDSDTRWMLSNFPYEHVTGTVDASPSPTTTSIDSTAIASSCDDVVAGRYIIQFLSGTHVGLVRDIIVSGTTGNHVVWSPTLGSAPSAGDSFEIMRSFEDHDSLAGFVSDEHIAHSGVVLTAGDGLSGGGNITASRSFNLSIGLLSTDTIVGADELAFSDTSGGSNNKVTVTNFITAIQPLTDHNSLLNYSANRHIDHSTVSISPGIGLSGGGTIAATRTLNLNIPGLDDDTSAGASDTLAIYDGAHKEITVANFQASLDHNSLSGYTANRHIDHSSVTLSAGLGLSGGGDITTSRTFTFAPSEFSTLSVGSIAGSDAFLLYDASASQAKRLDVDDVMVKAAENTSAVGYLQTRAGFTIQWGNFSAGGNTTTAETFAISFTTVRAVTVSGGYGTGANSQDNGPGVISISNSGFSVFSADDASNTVYWIAVGHI